MDNLIKGVGNLREGAIPQHHCELVYRREFCGRLDDIEGIRNRGISNAEAVNGKGAEAISVYGYVNVTVIKVVVGNVPVPIDTEC